MAKLWRTIALRLGLYAITNLPRNEAIPSHFLGETSCTKLVPFVPPWENGRLKQKIPSPGQSFATCRKRIQERCDGKKGEKGSLWLEERIEKQIKAESGACHGQAGEEYSDDVGTDRQDTGCMFRCRNLIFIKTQTGIIKQAQGI